MMVMKSRGFTWLAWFSWHGLNSGQVLAEAVSAHTCNPDEARDFFILCTGILPACVCLLDKWLIGRRAPEQR